MRRNRLNDFPLCLAPSGRPFLSQPYRGRRSSADAFVALPPAVAPCPFGTESMGVAAQLTAYGRFFMRSPPSPVARYHGGMKENKPNWTIPEPWLSIGIGLLIMAIPISVMIAVRLGLVPMHFSSP